MRSELNFCGYCGVVTAHGVLGVNAFKDIGAGMRNIFGGRSKSYENELASGVSDALAYVHGARDEQGEPVGPVHRHLRAANIIVDISGQRRHR